MFQSQAFVDPLQNRCSWIIHKIHTPVFESLFKKSLQMCTDVLQNNCFWKVRKAPLSESSLIKLQVLRTSTLSKKDSNRFLLVKFANFFKITLFYRPSLAAASNSFRFPACNISKKDIPAKMFFCEFSKIFKNIFWQNTSGWLLLVFIWEFCEVFQNISFIRAPLEAVLFHAQVA